MADKQHNQVIVSGAGLSIAEVMRVARDDARVGISDAVAVQERVRKSNEFILQAVAGNQPIYGVTSGFGAMAYKTISREQAIDLQNNIPWFHKVGAGNRIPGSDVRAAMLLRMNSLLRGASGIRMEMIERMATFLNRGATPHVYEFASIGASGDLSPLSYITANLIGLDAAWKSDYQGREVDAVSLLAELGLEPLRLGPKEGLAMVNGTAVMTGIAAGCVHDAGNMLALAMGAHALLLQGLAGTNQSFHPFIHQHKPLNGQLRAAQAMLDLLEGSQLICDELDGRHEFRGGDEPIQDRYSLRCLPQYMGPIIDGIITIAGQVETEINSATDNPLVDYENATTYHGGNFLGQYIGVGMDQLRYHLALLAKHLDIQIAMAATPAFSNGLSAMLVGNTGRSINGGLQGLQICGNCIMPQLSFYSNSLVVHYPSHAEGFNQNINSQGYGSANLSRRALEIFRQYMAIALLFGVQAVDLRSRLGCGHYDASRTLSPLSRELYRAIHEVIGRDFSADRALIWNDHEQAMDVYIAAIAADIGKGGKIVQAMQKVRAELLSGLAL
ncbi:MAG: aromatic amino acid ammonia-lyase [Pseudomonadales bacterium]|nr:aromatic amino acid ammonia-lyase [Pseudomonadales bacterium]